jgi:hypothetical protein
MIRFQPRTETAEAIGYARLRNGETDPGALTKMHLTRRAFLILAFAIPATWAAPGRGNDKRQGQSMTPAQAEQAARRQTGGGRVLSVKSADGGYQVKVLTPSGEVRYVFVSGR